MRNNSISDEPLPSIELDTDESDGNEQSDESLSSSTQPPDSSRSSAMIDAFKMKLLKLLELDKAPEPSEINLNENPIPEPILRELVQIGDAERRRRQRNNLSSLPTGDRSRSKRSLDDLQYEDDDNDDRHDELENLDETVRLNGSVVQQVTLLPKKCFF